MMTVLKIILEIIQENNTSVSVLTFIIIFMTVAHFYITLNLRVKYSKGACRGNTDKCRFDILNSQMRIVRLHFDIIKKNINNSYIKQLGEVSNKNVLINAHKGIIDLTINPIIEAFNIWLIDNHIPENSAEFDRYVNDKFYFAWSHMWATYAEHYSDKIFIVSIDKREEIWDSVKPEYLNMTFKIFKEISCEKQKID